MIGPVNESVSINKDKPFNKHKAFSINHVIILARDRQQIFTSDKFRKGKKLKLEFINEYKK